MSSLTRKMIYFVLACLWTVLPPAQPVVSAASLWSESGTNINMYSDRKAHAVGDTITVIVNESSSANRVGQANNTKSASTDMKSGVGIFSGIAAASSSGSDSFTAKGSLANTNVVTAKITAQVVEVRPNGSMMITGTQSISQNGEEQKITVSGLIRAEDITTDNTVLSSAIGDAKIKVEGNGPIANKQRQGILTRVFNFLF